MTRVIIIAEMDYWANRYKEELERTFPEIEINQSTLEGVLELNEEDNNDIVIINTYSIDTIKEKLKAPLTHLKEKKYRVIIVAPYALEKIIRLLFRDYQENDKKYGVIDIAFRDNELPAVIGRLLDQEKHKST